MRNDPSDTGGLFTGRRPGSQKPQYPDIPERGSSRRQRADRTLAVGLAAIMVLIVVLTVGALPPGALWAVAHVPFLEQRLFLALCVALGIILSLALGALWILTRMDRAWVLLRRGGGIEQRNGILPLIMAAGVSVALIAGGIYLIFLGGLASTPMGPQLP